MPLFGIGDVLMTTPALKLIGERTGLHLTILHMFKSTADVLADNPNVQENIHFPFLSAGRFASLRFLLSLRGRYDMSINFYPSNRRDYTLASFLSGCSERLGHRYLRGDIRELNFLKNRTVMEDDSLHNVQENLRLLKFLGIEDAESHPMEIFLNPQERGRAGEWIVQRGLEGRMLVGLHPGTSAFKDQYKRRWPAEKFSAFIREAAAAWPLASFVLFGGPEEEVLRDEVARGADLEGRVFSANLSGIRESIALIGACNYFITNDSGLMHAAATMQVPTVAIFGPTDPVYVHPWMCRHRVVTATGVCGPCFRYSPSPLRCAEDGEFPCVHRIEVGAVMEALDSLMSETP